jgi:hypothetical protein
MREFSFSDWKSPQLIWHGQKSHLYILGGTDSTSYSILQLPLTYDFKWVQPPFRQVGSSSDIKFPPILLPFLNDTRHPDSFQFRAYSATEEFKFAYYGESWSGFEPDSRHPKNDTPANTYVSPVAWLNESPPFATDILCTSSTDSSDYAVHRYALHEVPSLWFLLSIPGHALTLPNSTLGSVPSCFLRIGMPWHEQQSVLVDGIFVNSPIHNTGRFMQVRPNLYLLSGGTLQADLPNTRAWFYSTELFLPKVRWTPQCRWKGSSTHFRHHALVPGFVGDATALN